MLVKWRGWTVFVAVLTALALASCSEKSEDEPAPKDDFPLTYLGSEVVEAEGTLDRADALWERTHSEWGQVITVPDEARCYFLADDDGAIEKDGMCGPFRGLGTPAPEWVLIPFESRPLDLKSVELSPTSVVPYEKNPEYESLTLVRADGTEGDRDLEVPEPSGWPKVMKVGHSTVAPAKQFRRRQLVKAQVRMLGHDYTVRVVASRKAQFPDRSIYVAPKGGDLIDFRFQPFDSDTAEAATTALYNLLVTDRITLVVTADGRSLRGAYAISEGGGSGARTEAGGPSGFFAIPGADEVSYAIVVKGRRIEIEP